MLAIQNLPIGSRVRLKNGEVVEVADNPQDGAWLIVKAAGSSSEDLCGADEVAEILSQPADGSSR